MRARAGSSTERSAGVWRRLALSLGFLAVATGTVIAWRTPAEGYEVSIYAATPVPFWIGVSIAFLSAAVVVLVSCRDRLARLALGLGWLTTVAIGSLPVIRSYRFYGRADPMTHLGWATEILAGRMRFTDLFYPGGHSTTALLTDAMNVPIERGMILLAALYLSLYVLFIPLIVKALFGDRRITAIAAFSGFMILPVNQISSGLFFHTYSMAMFFFPVFLYAFVKHLKSGGKSGSLLEVAGEWNVVLAVLAVALIFLHPQLALNVVILLGVLVTLHVLLRNRSDLFVSDLRPVYGVFVLMTVCWVAWVTQFDAVFIVGESVMNSVYQTIFGAAEAGGSVQTRFQSARSVEATILELFVKLFLVPAAYFVLALFAVMFTVWRRFRSDDRNDRSESIDSRSHSVVTYFGYSGLVLGPFFVAHFLGPVSHLFFRHYGFAMVFVSVLGAVAIHQIGEFLSPGALRAAAKPAAVVLLVVALTLSLSTVFASPYIYGASHHVSDQRMDGYETAIEYRSEEIQWDGIRRGPGREFDALVPGVGLYDRPGVTTGDPTYGDEELETLLSGDIGEARYLPVTDADVDREVIAYREVRYSQKSLESIETHPGVHHVHDNGEFDLYYVTSRDAGTGVEAGGS